MTRIHMGWPQKCRKRVACLLRQKDGAHTTKLMYSVRTESTGAKGQRAVEKLSTFLAIFLGLSLMPNGVR